MWKLKILSLRDIPKHIPLNLGDPQDNCLVSWSKCYFLSTYKISRNFDIVTKIHALWISGTFAVPRMHTLSILHQGHMLDMVTGVSQPFFLFGKNDRHGRGHNWNTACAKKKKKRVKAWNTLYLRVTPTSFFFPPRMELGQIYFYFVISPFCPFILSAYA